MATNYKYIIDLSANTGKFNTQVDGVKKSIGGIEGIAKKASIAMAGVFTAAAIGAGVKAAINTIKNFEAALSSLSAITGATGKDLKFYEEAAIRTSKKTLQSATDIVKAYEMVGSASPILLKNKEALAKVTEQAIILSEATGGQLGLEGAISAVTASMNQFGIKGEEAGKIINVLAAGSLEGSAGVASITEAMKNVGTVADDSNLTLEQTVAMLEVLGEKQIFGAEAGTKLRGSLLLLKQAGLGYASGQFQVNDAIDEANKKLATFGTEAEKDAYKVKVFGAENITVGSIMLANKDKFNQLTTAITGTNVAMDQQRIQNDNLKGDLEKLSTSYDSFVISLNSGSSAVSKSLRSLIGMFQNVFDTESDTNILEKYGLSRRYFQDSEKAANGFIGKYRELNKAVDETIDKAKGVEDFQKAIDELTKSKGFFDNSKEGLANQKLYADLIERLTLAQNDYTTSINAATEAEKKSLSDDLAAKAKQKADDYKLITANVDKLAMSYREAADEMAPLWDMIKKSTGLDFSQKIQGPSGLVGGDREVGATNTEDIGEATSAWWNLGRVIDDVNTKQMAFGETMSAIQGIIMMGLADGAASFADYANIVVDSLFRVINVLLMEAAAGIIAHEGITKGVIGLGLAMAGIAVMYGMYKKFSGSVTAFADGGIVSGPTMALVGEYPGASNDPEVISPLSKLKDIIGNQGGFGGEVEFKIKGTELVGVLSNYNRKMSRIR